MTTTPTETESINDERATTLRALAIAELRALVAIVRRLCPDHNRHSTMSLPESEAGFAVLVAAGGEVHDTPYPGDYDHQSTIRAAEIIVDGVRISAQYTIPVRP